MSKRIFRVAAMLGALCLVPSNAHASFPDGVGPSPRDPRPPKPKLYGPPVDSVAFCAELALDDASRLAWVNR
jgi:hypothetical protein